MTTIKAGATTTLVYVYPDENGETQKRSPKATFTGKVYDIAGEKFYLFIHDKSKYEAYLSLDDLRRMQPKEIDAVEEVTY
jgi:hypothetical protein|tara:strand:+ start:5671 stop:5910 length:240 start_codon:yes stop_codon:yes gene_type:complete